MASYLNRVELLGQLTGEPGIRPSETGIQTVVFGLAVTTENVGFNGQVLKETCYLDVECSGATGQMVMGTLHSGMTVLVDGRIRMSQMIDRNTGRRISRHYVSADNVVAASEPMSDAEIGMIGQSVENVPVEMAEEPSF